MSRSKSLKTKSGHAPLSPSGSHRWLKCPASPGFIAKNWKELPPESEASEHSKLGTAAHLYGARLLRGERRVPAPADKEMVACIRDGYVPHVESAVKTMNGDLHVEKPVHLFYDTDETGTPDVIIVASKSLAVKDLKYGEGVSVEAKFNPQLAIYAESAIRKYHRKLKPDAPVLMEIYQPRAQDGRIVRKWTTTRDQLAQFTEDIEQTAKSILQDPHDQPFKPNADTTCRWCPAKCLCSAYAAHLLEETPPTMSKALTPVEYRLGLPKPASLNPTQLGRLLRVRKEIEDWLDEVSKYVLHRMERGDRYEGLKLVASKTNRSWSDQERAERMLAKVLDEDDLWKRSFVSPSQASGLLRPLTEKLGAGFFKKLSTLITKPEGRPVVAVKEDPRPPLDLDADNEFQNLDAESAKLL